MIAKGRGISKGFVNSYLGIKRGGRTIAMTRRSEHRIPATRFHDSLSGKARSKRICLGISTVGARARGSFEDVVARRQRQPLRSLHRERETQKKREAKERNEFSPLSQGFESRIANRRKMFETGIGPRTRDEIPSGNIVPSLLSKRSLAREGGLFDHRNRSSLMGHRIPDIFSWLLFLSSLFFSRIQISNRSSLISTFNSGELHYILARESREICVLATEISSTCTYAHSCVCIKRAPICITYMRRRRKEGLELFV